MRQYEAQTETHVDQRCLQDAEQATSKAPGGEAEACRVGATNLRRALSLDLLETSILSTGIGVSFSSPDRLRHTR